MSASSDPLLLWSWWRDLGERLARQGMQSAAPVLAAVVAAQGRVDVVATLVALAGVLVVTTVKAALSEVGVFANTGSLFERMVGAFAATALGMWPDSWLGIAHLDWRAVLTAAATSAVLAAVTYVLAPPAQVAASRALAEVKA